MLVDVALLGQKNDRGMYFVAVWVRRVFVTERVNHFSLLNDRTFVSIFFVHCGALLVYIRTQLFVSLVRCIRMLLTKLRICNKI